MGCQRVYELNLFMKFIKLSLYIILSISGFTVSAEFHHVLTTPLALNVDVVPRNTKVGEDESLHLRLYKWISVSEDMSVGLSERGEVFGVVSLLKTNEQTGQKIRKNYAYLLSGTRDIREIFLDENETLWAIDHSGGVLVFDRREWLRTPLMRVLRDAGLSIVDDISIFGILFLTTKQIFFNPWDLGPMPTAIVAGLGAVGFGISQFLRGANRYERWNRTTDAFVSTGKNIELGLNVGERFAEFVRKIHIEKEHLNNRFLFDRKCELKLLPLPVDHSTWKP